METTVMNMMTTEIDGWMTNEWLMMVEYNYGFGSGCNHHKEKAKIASHEINEVVIILPDWWPESVANGDGYHTICNYHTMVRCHHVSSSGGIHDECDELLRESRCTSERCVAECVVWQATAIVRRTDKVGRNVVLWYIMAWYNEVQCTIISFVFPFFQELREYLSVSFQRKYKNKNQGSKVWW